MRTVTVKNVTAPPHAAVEAMVEWMQAHPEVWRSWWPSWGAGLDRREQHRRLYRLLWQPEPAPGVMTFASDPAWIGNRGAFRDMAKKYRETPLERFVAMADAAVGAARAAKRQRVEVALRRLDVPRGHGVYEGVELGC